MKPEEFITQLEQEQIVAAIRQAETKTSGEIRVFVSRQPVESPVTAAQAQFSALKMTNTRERNGILIFVAPVTRKFAVIGDEGIHSRCGEPFWNELANELSSHFRQGEFSSGIIHAIQKAGDLLSRHFPRRNDDSNELPDTIVLD